MAKRKSAQQRPRVWRTVVALLLGIGFFAVLSWYANKGQRSVPSATEEGATPPFYKSAEAAKPFPRLVLPSRFRDYAPAANAYQIAAHIPGILAQQPCYCHCESFGHRSLLDCYASDHAAG